MNLYEEIELQEMQRTVDSLATENQMLQEPKTPTQEQIEEILSVVPVEDGKYVIPQIITEWEKIRNQQ